VAGLARRHSACDILLDETIDVVPQLVIELTLDLIALEQRPDPQSKFADPTHGKSILKQA
jgi:hypothetical protein